MKIKSPKQWHKLQPKDQIATFEHIQSKLKIVQACNKSMEFSLKMAMKYLAHEIHKTQSGEFVERVDDVK